MKIFRLNSWSLAGAVATALLLNACAPGQDAPTPTTSLNVSRYLAVGDSYTAGLSAGGLTRASQEYSFPNLLARQFRLASPEAIFSQPLLEAGSGSGYLALVDFTTNGVARSRRVAGQAVRRSVINPTACGGADTLRLLTRSATAGTLPQNLGVPGLFLSQIETLNLGNEVTATPGTAFNPYFERLLPAGDSRSYLQVVEAAAPSATFFTFFMGLDELMPYLRSGGDCSGLDGSVKRRATLQAMKDNARKALDRLRAGGQPGIIARLPDPANLPLLRLGRGLALQARLQAQAGDTAQVYIQSPTGSGPAQPITNEDYVLATALLRVGQLTPVVVGGTTMQLPYGRDIRNPLRDSDVIDSRELSVVTSLIITPYNEELDRLAQDVYKLPIITVSDKKRTLDSNLAFPGLTSEAISVNGVVFSREPIRGNFFSLDYYTLSPRGNALLANTFITALNKTYNSRIPAIDVNSLPNIAQ